MFVKYKVVIEFDGIPKEFYYGADQKAEAFCCFDNLSLRCKKCNLFENVNGSWTDISEADIYM